MGYKMVRGYPFQLSELELAIAELSMTMKSFKGKVLMYASPYSQWEVARQCLINAEKALVKARVEARKLALLAPPERRLKSVGRTDEHTA